MLKVGGDFSHSLVNLLALLAPPQGLLGIAKPTPHLLNHPVLQTHCPLPHTPPPWHWECWVRTTRSGSLHSSPLVREQEGTSERAQIPPGKQDAPFPIHLPHEAGEGRHGALPFLPHCLEQAPGANGLSFCSLASSPPPECVGRSCRGHRGPSQHFQHGWVREAPAQARSGGAGVRELEGSNMVPGVSC